MIVDVSKMGRYGHNDRARVWLNGEDVSSRAVYADDGVGMVKLYKVNPAGKITNPPTLIRHFGDVRIEFPTENKETT